MARPQITLYFDIVSPFGYLGFYALRNFPVFEQCDISYVPIFLGGLMKACENRPPLTVKNKGEWSNKQRLHWSTRFKIPMMKGLPDGFPINSLGIQRTLTAVSLKNSTAVAPAAESLFKAAWADGQNLMDAGTVAAILSGVLGGKGAEDALAAAQSPEVKQKLVKNTEQAFADGAFGLPWFVAVNAKGEKEGFWGFDSMGQLIDHLGLERPMTGGWKAVL